jgi:hypothetical protein
MIGASEAETGRHPSRGQGWRAVVVLGVAALLGGCFAPPSNAQRVGDAARDLNVAARFGNLEAAAALAAPAVRSEFLARRALWGNEIRVLDVELVGLDVNEDTERAFVQVNVSWMRTSESTLRVTRVAQTWRQRDGDWLLTQEERIAGDVGVFGEPVTVLQPEPTAPAPRFATQRLSPVIE